MCFFGDSIKKIEHTDPELVRISRERLIFRSFLVLGILLILGFVAYLIWYLQ